ncbi:MAG: hybrid sensor histidine kinase/response regulator [Myxococcales bacterium]
MAERPHRTPLKGRDRAARPAASARKEAAPSGSEPSRAELAARLAEAEERRARDARALSDLGGSVGLPLATAFKRQLAVVARIFEPETAFVLLHDPVADRLNVAAVRGRAARAAVAARPGQGPTGRAFSEAKVQLGWTSRQDRRRGGRVKIDDPLLALAVARRRAAQETASLQNVVPPEPTGNAAAIRLVAVPMLSSGRCVGVLALLRPRLEGGGEPLPAEIDLLLALGAQGAAAVEMARLRDDAIRRSRDLETALAGTRSVAQSRDEALGTLAHELRTPLATVKGYLQVLRRGQLGELSLQQREVVEACARNTERIQRLIHDLVLASRLSGGRMDLDPKPIGLKGLISEAIVELTPLAAEQGVTVTLSPGDAAFVRGNRDRLADALLNVIDNAIRYNDKGGHVKVQVATQGAVARVTVEDDGPGLPPEEARHAFDRYLELEVSPRGGRVGVGLGLAVVRQIVERHGGRAQLESTPGRGTRVALDLPLFAGAAALAGERRPSAAGDGRILLVEDDADCRAALQLVLQNEGYAVEVASGGREALAALGRERPSLMLLDLHMPDLDGRLLLKRIRKEERLSDLPVFVISGAIDAAAGVGALAPGEEVAGVFEKPLNFPRLLEQIAGHLGPPRG